MVLAVTVMVVAIPGPHLGVWIWSHSGTSGSWDPGIGILGSWDPGVEQLVGPHPIGRMVAGYLVLEVVVAAATGYWCMGRVGTWCSVVVYVQCMVHSMV